MTPHSRDFDKLASCVKQTFTEASIAIVHRLEPWDKKRYFDVVADGHKFLPSVDGIIEGEARVSWSVGVVDTSTKNQPNQRFRRLLHKMSVMKEKFNNGIAFQLGGDKLGQLQYKWE